MLLAWQIGFLACSQPNYEEWKRLTLKTRKWTVFGSQPNYEEWKHDLQGVTLRSKTGSQPNYEEWKHRARTSQPEQL